MKAVIFAILFFFTVISRVFCEEAVAPGIEIRDRSYFIEFEIRVNVKKEKTMEIFNDSEKLKSLSYVIKDVKVVEKAVNGVIRKNRTIKFCLFGICMEAIQNNVPEFGDSVIEIVIPRQTNFEQSVMRFEVCENSNVKTIIRCKLEAKPQFIARTALIFVSKKKIESKLVDVREKLAKKIEYLAAKEEAIKCENK